MRHQCHSRCLRTSEQCCARSTCAALRDREATLYALDLQCAVGTPVLAIADGKVEKIEQQRFGGGAPAHRSQTTRRRSARRVQLTRECIFPGIHVTSLFKWNSIMLALADGRFAEYVHIRGGSAVVAVGQRVVAGQQLCESGDVGFCPTPHLHLQLHDSVTALPSCAWLVRCWPFCGLVAVLLR